MAITQTVQESAAVKLLEDIGYVVLTVEEASAVSMIMEAITEQEESRIFEDDPSARRAYLRVDSKVNKSLGATWRLRGAAGPSAPRSVA
jgi:hypothetical protein